MTGAEFFKPPGFDEIVYATPENRERAKQERFRQQMDRAEARVLRELNDTLRRVLRLKGDRRGEELLSYAKHVFDGGDPEFKPWWVGRD